jgi:predicted nuclease with TOPRIM domain
MSEYKEHLENTEVERLYKELSAEFVRRGIGSLDFSKLNQLYTLASIGQNAKSEYREIQELEKENERLNQQGAFFAAKSEELERKLEVAVNALWALVDDIDTPFRLGLSEKPNPEWHNLNRARQCLREIGE